VRYPNKQYKKLSYPIPPANKSKLQSVRPSPRDGHSCVIFGYNMFIFGGDRYHMPFNDLFIFDLLTELEERELIAD